MALFAGDLFLAGFVYQISCNVPVPVPVNLPNLSEEKKGLHIVEKGQF